MTLHKKTLLVLSVALACLVVVLYFILSSLLLGGFSDVEDDQMHRDVERVSDTISDDIDYFSNITRDWSAWDDTYEYVVDVNDDYFDSNIDVPEAWTLNRVDVMLYINADGEVIFGEGYDAEEEEFVPASEDLLTFVATDETLLQHEEVDGYFEGHEGIVLLEEGPIMLASQPIITSDEEGPLRGSLVWGRYLNEAQVEQLAAITHSNLTLEILASEDLPADFVDVLPSLSQSGQVAVTPMDDEVVAGYTLLEDINGEPALILKIDEERAIFAQGQSTMKYIVLSVLLVGLLFGALTIYLMERFVLSRVSRISSEVSAIEAEGDHSGRIHVTGQDELTKMASAVNNMLTALEETQSALRKSHDSLEVKVQERTTDLTHKIAVLKTLSEVGNEIMMATEAGRLTNLVCRHARELFHAPKVLIAVTDSSGGNHISASCGLSDITATEDDMKLLLKQGFFNNDEVVGQGSINLDSFGSNSEVGRELRKREAIKATAVAPLIAEGKTLGAIFLFDTVSRTFTEEEIQTLELLAGQVALALDTTHLLKEENTRREELASLYDLARKLADTAPDVNTILSLAAEHAANNVQVTFARFVMIEEDKLVGHAVYPRRIISDDRTIGHGIPLAFLPYCQRVLKQKDPVVLRDDAADLSNSEHEMLFLKTAKSVCLVPLFAGEGPLGILVLGEARETDREPLTPEKLHLASSIGDQTASTLRRAELFSELERAYLQTVLALANAVDAKDTYTADHGSRLAQLASAVGNRLDLTPREMDDMRYGALLHDVGKIGIPDAILLKPAKLTDEEWDEMRKHPDIGAQILAPVPFLGGACQVVKHHHERVDGGGYPDGLIGDSIPIGARILAVVDSYCAIRDKRVYKDARTHEDAVSELLRCSGQQFDTRVVATFLELIEKKELDIEQVLIQMNEEKSASDGDAKKDGDTEAA